MEIQLALAASRNQRDAFFARLAQRGYQLIERPRADGSVSRKMSKEFIDSVTGEFRARVNVTAIPIGSEDFEYSLYVETHAHDSMTGENVAEGHSVEMATQQQYRMENFVMFIDSALTMPACKGIFPQ